MTKIAIKQNNLDNIMALLTKTSMILCDVTNKSFSSFQGNELLCSGLNKVTKNMNTIGERSRNTSSIISKQQESFFLVENLVSDLIEEIEIPSDLANVYSPVQEVISDVSLLKEDGNSVSNGSYADTSNLDFNDGLREEILGSIRNDNLQSLESDFSSDVQEKTLTDITSKDIDEQSLDFNYNKEEEVLRDISQGLEPVDNTLDFNMDSDEVLLYDMLGLDTNLTDTNSI